VEKFKHIGMVFASDGRWSEEIDTRISKANAVLLELDHSVVTTRELSNNTKLSVFKSVFVPILTYGPESWVMTERISVQVQAPELEFLRSPWCDMGVPRLDAARARNNLGAPMFEPKVFWE